MQLGPADPNNTQATTLETETGQSTPSDADTTALTAQSTTQPTAITRLMDRIQSSDTMLPNILLVGGVLLMVIIMMRSLRKKTKNDRRRMNTQGTPDERIAQIHANAQSSMDPPRRLMVEAEEMARQLGAVLDNKAARLELLIEEADKKLAALNRTLVGSSIGAQPSELPTQSQPAPSRTIDPTLLDRARLEQDLAERQSRVAGRIDPSPLEPTEPEPAEPQSTQSKVIELAETGLSNIEIAHQLNQPIGQVELILNLRKHQG